MANQQTTSKIQFHGGVINRVLIVFQKNCCNNYNLSDYDFIRKKFNGLRNFRSFSKDYPVKLIEARTDNLPDITTLQSGDACLLIGSGRLIDKECFEFAKECFSHNIPVFFVRSNSLDYDSRITNPMWKIHSLTVKTATGLQSSNAPAKYFMEIPSINDFILSQWTDDFYALLPGMVPM